jgi:Protein of unknown function (DUF2934)
MAETDQEYSIQEQFGLPSSEQIALATRQLIEQRAYEIYLERGGADGDDVADWLIAEQELAQGPSTSLGTADGAAAGSIQLEDAEKAIEEIRENSRAVAARAGS